MLAGQLLNTSDFLRRPNPCHLSLFYLMLFMPFFPTAKIRRLYDIANVLSSLDLIKKVHVTEERGRKPAFKWTGPEISPNASGAYGVLLLFSFHCLFLIQMDSFPSILHAAPPMGRPSVDDWKSSLLVKKIGCSVIGHSRGEVLWVQEFGMEALELW